MNEEKNKPGPVHELDRFRELLHKASGIRLSPEKSTLLRARLSKRMRALGMDSIHQYYGRVVEDRTGGELDRLVDCLTTNKTEFFREAAHFTHFQKVTVPGWLGARKGNPLEPLRVWSAACSSGEEAYSLGMCALESAGEGCGVKVLGTDISERMVEKALAGWYETDKARPIPGPLKERYMEKEDRPGGKGWAAGEKLRKVVFFSRLNLNGGEFPFRNPFDAIFCRNVMIYFDRDSQTDLLRRLCSVLKPGGFLYTGLSESLIGISHGLRMMEPSVYQKP